MIRKDLSVLGVLGVLLPAAIAVGAPDRNSKSPTACGGLWTQGGSFPAGLLSAHAMAFDAARGVVVLFARGSSAPPDETWEYDGQWRLVAPATKPPGRGWHAMVYDSTRRVVVMFGGYGSAGSLADTWSYDGLTWSALPVAGPAARDSHAMAYDSLRQRVVLFGGATGGSWPFRDTWELDAIGWTMKPAAPPGLTARSLHAMCYDTNRARTVLFGGNDAGGVYQNDTWEYDGVQWTPGPAAPASLVTREGHAMAYDTTRRLCVLFGGLHDVTTLLDDTWELDGVQWLPGPPPGSGPAPRFSFGMTYDDSRQVTVIFGGVGAFTDTWELAGSLNIYPPTLPDGNEGGAYAQTLSALGGTSPYSFGIAAGALPAGLALSSAGTLSGMPSVAGIFSFDVSTSDGSACTGLRHFDLIVHPQSCGPLTMAPPNLPLATMGYLYSVTLQASGGYPPYSYAVSSGPLVPGLGLTPSGIISGAPTVAGAYAFDVTVTDVVGCTGIASYVVVVRLAVDVVSGQGHGPTNGNGVAVNKSDGTGTPVSFLAYGAGQWGTNVGTANVGATSIEEIITGPGPGPVYGPQVKGWNRNGTFIRGINFFAYGTPKMGVNVAGGTIDADAFDEILTGAGPGTVFGPHVRGFDYDGLAVRAIAKVSFFAYGTLQWGVHCAAGSVDGDLFEEIVTGPGPGPSFLPHVRGFDYDGAAVTSIAKLSFQAYPTTGYGVWTALGDVDADGFAEIATAPGASPLLAARFLGFNYDGAAVGALSGFDATPYATVYGGRLSIGDMAPGLTIRDELVTGAGPDPSAPATVMMFDYRGGLFPLPSSFTPFPGGHGVNVACGALGF